jgi:hypothetical protein
MKTALIIVLTSTLTACIAVPTSQTNPVRGDLIIARNANAPVCIVVPEDGSYNGHAYIRSGLLIANRIEHFVQKIGRSTCQVTKGTESFQAACIQAGAEMVLVPQILTYENRATGWSGKPDRIEIRLTLANIWQLDRERTVVYEARSNILASAFLEWGNANPVALLGAEFGETIERLFEQP